MRCTAAAKARAQAGGASARSGSVVPAASTWPFDMVNRFIASASPTPMPASTSRSAVPLCRSRANRGEGETPA